MKILVIANGITHIGASGGDVHILKVYQRLLKAGCNLYLMSSDIGITLFLDSDKNTSFYNVSTRLDSKLCQKLTLLRLLLLYALRMFKAIFYSFKSKADIICSSSSIVFDVLPAVVARFTHPGSRLIFYFHHIIPPTSARSIRYRNLTHFSWNTLAFILQEICIKLIRHYADLIFVVNTFTRDALVKHGVSQDKIEVTTNGVDLSFIESIGKSQEIKFEGCFLGRLSPIKGVFDLVEIWKEVCSVFPSAKLVFIGTGAKGFIESLTQEISIKGISNNIILLGEVPEREKYMTLKSSKVFLFPSYEEGWGIAVCEAMACALPAVTYDLPAYTIFRNGVIKVPIGDIGAFAKAVVCLLANQNLNEEIRKRAEATASRFDWNNVMDKELSSIQKLVRNSYPSSLTGEV